MGGEVLELASERYERLCREAELRGEFRVYLNMGFTLEKISELTGKSVEQIKEILQELGLK